MKQSTASGVSGPARDRQGLLAGAALMVLAACSGEVDQRKGAPGQAGPGGGSTPGPAGGPDGTGPSASGQTPPPAPGTVMAAVAPLRRLTAEQYRNTVRDLLGLSEPPALSLPGDDAVADRFLSNTTSAVKSVDLDRYADAAESLAKTAVENLAGLLPCQPSAGAEASCARSFIERFGRRAYRRPLGAAEIARLEKVHASAGAFKAGIELVITALLQSPKFLYLHEPVPSDAAGVVAVDKHALASRLSYFILGTMPDDGLLEAADKGQLASPEQVSAQADRLMKDPRFAATLGSFHSQWLALHEVGGADKDAKLFPEAVWNPTIKAALAEESRRFVNHVLEEGDGKLETLLAASFSVLSGPLYEYYGVTRPAGPAADAWQRAELPRDQRAGLLTQGSLLAGQAHADRTSFILRGKLIREALLCTPIPPPPPDASANEMQIPATATAKERAAAHRSRPDCAACHELFDPIGFAFESYDAAGRFRSTEGGKAVETAVEITRTQTLDGPVANAVELARKLGTADEVRDCVARQWMRFALGREDAPDDKGALGAASKAFREGGGKIRDLLAALARSDAFRYQTARP